jgi:hypothetical protein
VYFLENFTAWYGYQAIFFRIADFGFEKEVFRPYLRAALYKKRCSRSALIGERVAPRTAAGSAALHQEEERL